MNERLLFQSLGSVWTSGANMLSSAPILPVGLNRLSHKNALLAASWNQGALDWSLTS